MKFSFVVNPSFVGYSTHPITIPRSQVDYSGMGRLLVGTVQVIVRAPNGAFCPGRLYSGESSWGRYHQVRAEIPRQGWLHGLGVGDRVIVHLVRVGSVLVVDVQKPLASGVLTAA